MMKNKIVYLVLFCLGFLFVSIGGVFLILSVFMDIKTGIYVGLGIILFSIVFYVLIGIIFLINYFKSRR